ncbi:MAG: heparinase II/III family protein [Clostridia bacterium]|nr:heparinase II/III family protein [Clostridia bacterium]
MSKLLTAYYSPTSVAPLLVPQPAFHPYPRWGEENTLTKAQKAEMIAAGEAYLGYGWPVATAMQYLAFATIGSRVHYETPNAANRRALSALIDAEYAEQKGRFIPDIINGLWAAMDEATWVVPAHNDGHELPNFDRPAIIGLFSAGTSGMLANAYYLFKEQIDAVTPLVLRRLEKVLEERMMAPFMDNLYWWSGATGTAACNWTPWIVSNALLCFGILEKDEARRAAAVARGIWMVDNFLDEYNLDGGCDEGPSYWGKAGGALFDCLCLLGDLTGGAFESLFKEPLVQNIGRYIYRAHIVDGDFTNYADAQRKFRASTDMIYRYGKKIDDDNMVRLGVALHRLYKEEDSHVDPEAAKVPDMHGDYRHHYRHMVAAVSFAELENAEDRGFPLLESVFIDGTEMIAERQQGGTTEGLYLSAKGGHNNESHNHNDIGSFVVYSDGQQAIVDLGAGLYTAKTFGPERYTIPQMQSSYHNLPEINGVMQHEGAQYTSANVSYKNEGGVTVFSEDIAGAYPTAAGVNTWQRTFTFNRAEKTIILADEAEFVGEKNHLETMFILPVEPVLEGGVVTIPLENARPVVITGEDVTFSVEEVDLSYDEKLYIYWNKRVWRVKAAADCGKNYSRRFTIAQP